jgi:DNA-binding transcriptional MerR regulator
MSDEKSMRERFRGHYRPTPAELDEIWKNGLIVPDANVLLNLYRYSSRTRDEWFEVFRKLEDRVWISNQAALEYQQNRLRVIQKQEDYYSELEALLAKMRNQLISKANELKRHPILEASVILSEVDKFSDGLQNHIANWRNQHTLTFGTMQLLLEDPIRERLTSQLGARVGPPFSQDQLSEIYAEGEERYEVEIPPGYADRTKPDSEKFGDLIFWLQTIEKAKESKLSVLVITDDQKDDWWWNFKGLTIGPRPELIEEMREKAGVQVHMYTSAQFLENARVYLEQVVSDEAIGEVERVGTWRVDEDIDSTFKESEIPISSLRQMSLDEGVTNRIAAQLAGISMRQLIYWARTGLVAPSAEGGKRYSRRDLLCLLIVKRLLDSHLSLKAARMAIGLFSGEKIKDLSKIALAVGPSSASLFNEDNLTDVLQEATDALIVIPLGGLSQELQDRFDSLREEAFGDP